MKIKYILGTAYIFLTFAATAQFNTEQYDADSSTYYSRFWTANLDSIEKSWIAKKIHTFSENSVKFFTENQPDNFIKTAGFQSTSQSAALSNLYKSNIQKTNLALALFNFHKKYFEKALINNNLPVELSVLPFAMTAMNVHARSYTGGAGFWQLNYSVGRRQGLTIDSYVDERLDPVKSSAAAAAYLKDLYSIYKDWKLVLAAYSCGPSAVNKAIRRNDNTIDFYSIRNSLPYFGNDIVDAFMASISLLEDYSTNYFVDYSQKPDTVEVSKKMHFIQLQDVLGFNIQEIRFLNPVFKNDIVPAVNHIYKIYLPKGNLPNFNRLEDSIYSYQDSTLFSIQRKVVLPPPPSGRYWATPQKEETPDNATLVYYTIKSGDNLGLVAGWYDVRVSQLEDWNNIYDPRRIQIGKKLKIYVPKSKSYYYKKIDKLGSSQKRNLVAEGKTNQSTPKTEDKTEISGDDFFYHTVRPGESPYTIASRYPGVTADDILKWNGIKDATKIQVGQKLKIKRNP